VTNGDGLTDNQRRIASALKFKKNISKFYNVILILRTTIYKAADLQPIENGVLVVETNQISSNCQLHYFLPK
jgi:hypothetical protein